MTFLITWSSGKKSISQEKRISVESGSMEKTELYVKRWDIIILLI
jgi:hypothetical protein